MLRDLTRSQHQQLDDAIGPLDRAESYGAYVSAMHAFRRPVEAHLAQAGLPQEFGAWTPTLIAPELTADLGDLGLAEGVRQEWSGESGVSRLLGTLYVLEGSALGARLIRERAALLGYSEEHGARHLYRQTEDGQAWSAFRDLLERVEAFDLGEAVASAQRTFDFAYSMFRKVPHVPAQG